MKIIDQFRKAVWIQRAILAVLMPGLMMMSDVVRANPSGGVVVHGDIGFEGLNTASLRITQGSDKAIINWQDFSIGKGEITEFIQPGKNSAVLNRVVSGNPSAIFGTLKANGGVMVVNTNGILVGAGGVIDVVGNLTLSTLDIDNNDFLNGGDNRFRGNSSAGVQNFGTISSSEGDVILLGNFVENHGSIGALNGQVALGAGGDIIVHETGDAKITVRAGGVGGQTGITNTGSIKGAAAELKAHGNVYALAINNSGAIRATGSERINGRVILSAGEGGNITNTGTIEAMNRNGDGGEILIDGGRTGVVDLASGRVSANGRNGGTVTVLGQEINVGPTAEVTADGDVRGGTVNLGSAEYSSLINVDGKVSASGATGGSVNIAGTPGGVVNLNGSILATGTDVGGQVTVNGGTVTQGPNSMINVGGGNAGGLISIDGANVTTIGGGLNASSSAGAAGSIAVLGTEVVARETASLNASGFSRGGVVRVGGDLRGSDALGFREANVTTFEDGAKINVDGLNGDAGLAVVWSNGDTIFNGDVSAAARGPEGNGGLIEVSGLNHLNFRGDVNASSIGGHSGTVLFDPGDILVGGGASDIPIANINSILQGGTSVLIFTESGDITFEDLLPDTATQDFNNSNRDSSIQWTHSGASFGAFASGNIFVNTNIRTSGGGSINLISGWTGLEADFDTAGLFENDFVAGAIDDSAGGRFFQAGGLALFNPEDVWDYYVENGQFGQGGSTFIGSSAMNNAIEVGSRFGNTNVAAANLFIIAADTNGESRYAQLGFRDAGQVFAPRADNAQFNLNGASDVDGDPAVGIAGMFEVDVNGDGVADGVQAINSTGAVAGSMIRYANHFNSARAGGWWWQQLDPGNNANGVDGNHDPLGLGGLRPENGAGQSELNRADINVITTASVNLLGGGRHAGAAQIGHGGDASGWADNRSLAGNGTEGNNSAATGFSAAITESFPNNWAINGASNDRVATSISRLAPVYGNINVLAGVNTSEAIIYNRDAATQNLTATVDNTAGSVNLQGLQRLGSSDSPSNINAQGGQFAPVIIGHGGTGQAGKFVGDIYVEAGGDVNILAGSQIRDAAVIGHMTNGYAYWNPSDNVDQQIRFFANIGDFRDPNLRRGELFNPAGVPTHSIADGAGDTYIDPDGRRNDGGSYELEFSPAGVITVGAIDGSTVKGFHGDITVISKGNGGITIKGYETPDSRDPGLIGTLLPGDPANGQRNSREDRYAGIGHGGRGFAVNTEEAGYTLNRTDRFQEFVGWRIVGADETTGSGSMSILTEAGGGLDRALTFMNITGNIDVQATQGDIVVQAGNNAFNHAYIGHNGRQLVDVETSGVMIGDINVEADGHIVLIGPGLTDYTGDSNQNFRSQAMIGHGGWRNGFMYIGGDINVSAQANGAAPTFDSQSVFADSALTPTIVADGITLIGGAYQESFAKIGHGGTNSWGQVGGDFTRIENFTFDNVSTDISISFVGGVLDIQYTGVADGITNANGDHTAGDPTELGITERIIMGGLANSNSGGTAMTSNIDVYSGSKITMAHLEPGDSITDNQFLFDTDGGSSPATDSFVQIGHGGSEVDSLSTTGLSALYNDKIGNITVTSVGDLLMENGAYDGKWTRIGHGGGDNTDRVGGNDAMTLAGDIDLTVGGSLMMDGRAGGETDPNFANVGVTGFGNPTQRNSIRIGHGGVFDNFDLVVVEGTVNGIDLTSSITVDVAQDLTMHGGSGYQASQTQIGHGYASDVANDRSRSNNIPTGFSGDITVIVGNDLYMEASANAYNLTPTDGVEFFALGASAVIGHGGSLLDAPASGDISVFTGNNLTMVGSQRTEALAVDDTGVPVGSALHTVKIGHYSNEIDRANGQNGVTESDMNGDILIVVTNDLNMIGSSTPDAINQPILGAINQIGHGGPGIDGDKIGNITILVGNDFVATGGEPEVPGIQDSNNYTMIGNGDWLRDGFSIGAFQGPGPGLRQGDINIAVGNNATFGATADGDTTDTTARPVLIGHADKAVQPSTLSILSGTTRVAVSRNFPFYGGEGTLTAVDGSVFSSGLYGAGGNVEFYIPERDNNLMGLTTRINEATITYVGTEANFADSTGTTGITFDSTRGIFAGREDEVYLTPDLWWDVDGLSVTISGSQPFPTSLADVQGGALAIVEAPGGIPNLVANNSGTLGESAPTYRGANGVSGSGQYTIYYDAIEPVSTQPASIPTTPIVFVPEIIENEIILDIPFDFYPFIFLEKFDSFDRDDLGLDGLTGDENGLFAALGLFESEENTDESGVLDAERALDNFFGDRKDEDSEGEKDEEKQRKRERNTRAVGNIGLIFYVFDPQGNKYSSHRVFGVNQTLLPAGL